VDPGISTVTFYSWNFGDGNQLIDVPAGTILNDLVTNTFGPIEEPKHSYASNGVFNAMLSVKTNDGCDNASPSEQVSILPSGATVTPTPVAAYFNDFEASNGGWIEEGLRLSAPGIFPIVRSPFSWQYGTPNGSYIKTAASGINAWWTGFNQTANAQPTYFDNESSFINGPCFDLRQLKRPMISINYWSDSERNLDGVVLQYSTNGGQAWAIVGPLAGLPQRDQGINWYAPNATIVSNPGQQLVGQYGWTGETGKWLNGRFNLDMVDPAQRGQVRIRLAFASNDKNAVRQPALGYDGFAFDDVFVGDKQRVVLVEHFTNSSFVSIDNYLNTLYSNEINLRPPDGTDFNSIQYHMSFSSSSSDSLVNNNSNARAQSFGVSTPPKTFMDGINKRNSKFDGTTTNLNNVEIDRRALTSPKFRLRLDTIATGKKNFINVQMTLTADTIVNSPLIAQVALVEDSVVNSAGTFKNVLRKLLYGSDATKPDGITINQPFAIGQVAVRPQPANEIEINVPILEPNNLWLIGFVQDKNTGEILQSTILKAPNKEGSIIVGIEPTNQTGDINDLQIYPNPANGKFNFALPGNFPAGYVWKIADQRGIFVQKGNFDSSTDGVVTVDVSSLVNSVYFVLIGAEGKVPVYRKLVVMNQN